MLIACQSEAEVHRLTEVLKAGKLAASHRLQLVTGHVRAGFRLVETGTVVLGSHELFHKDLLPPGVKVKTHSSRTLESRAIDSFLDLNDGDYVVHVAHGIARFRGMKMLEKGARGEGQGAREDTDEASDPLAPDPSPLAAARSRRLPEGGLRMPSAILCDAIRSIDQRRLIDCWGTVNVSTMSTVEDRLRRLLGL